MTDQKQQKLAEIRRMAADGMTMDVASKTLGITLSTLAGMATRAGIRFGGRHLSKTLRTAIGNTGRKHGSSRMANIRSGFGAEISVREMPAEATPPQRGHLPGPGCCQWFLGAPMGDFRKQMACGKPVEDEIGTPYCAQHAATAKPVRKPAS